MADRKNEIVAGETITNIGALQKELNRELLNFAESHPTFAEEFDVADDDSVDHVNVLAGGFRDGIPTEEEVVKSPEEFSISTEWGFATAFGYKIAIHDFLKLVREENE